MSREKLPIPSSADSSLNEPGLLNKLRSNIKALIVCGALTAVGCGTTSHIQINHVTSNNKIENKVGDKVDNKDADKKADDKKVKPGNEVKDDEDKSGSRGYRGEEDIPCDELDLSEPGACVQV